MKYETLLSKSSSFDEHSLPYNGDAPEISYSWSNINVFATRKSEVGSRTSTITKVKNWLCGRKAATLEKHILKNVSGICRPGELLAILGASGAGKTTLLNVLTFRNNDKVRIQGDLFVNGWRANPEYLTSHSAYVQQDDMFIGALKVKEQLIFQALLRMDRHISYEARMIRVNEVIVELGLSKCADNFIGVPGRIKGISGGEMKRLAFACEVLTNPTLFFCDEPTSGLDSFMAQNVVAVMKNMAEKGKTILSTIHQPSSEVYAMFDRIMLMAEGRVAFLGDADEAYGFFNRIGLPCPPNYNPADFFIATLAVQPRKEESCRQAIHSICDQFSESEGGKTIEEAVKMNMKNEEASHEIDFVEEKDGSKKISMYKATWWQQFRILLWRSWLEVTREPMIIKIRFFQVSLIGLILGVLYFKTVLDQDGIANIQGVIYLLLTNSTFQNVFGVINTFCIQIPIFLREHFNGMYRTDVYFLAKSTAELPFQLIFPVVLIGIVYYMAGLAPQVGRFFTSVGIIILVSNTCVSYGYLVSCSSKNLNVALVVAVPFIIPLLLFGGFLLNKNSTPPYLVFFRYLSWFHYGNEALNINQWSNISSIACKGNQTCFPDGHSVLRYLAYDDGSIIVDALCLFCLMVFYRLLAFFALLLKTVRKK